MISLAFLLPTVPKCTIRDLEASLLQALKGNPHLADVHSPCVLDGIPDLKLLLPRDSTLFYSPNQMQGSSHSIEMIISD